MSIRLLIEERFPMLSPDRVSRVVLFHDLLLEENKVQNLTRLTSDLDFIEGHLLDCVELLRAFGHVLGSHVVDLGSGCGVPGLLSLIIDENPTRKWTLVDSERSKVDFLQRAISILELNDRAEAIWIRGAEYFLRQKTPFSILSRAVGSLSRVLSWLDSCSTWNNLYLFKGPAWDGEWESTSTQIKKKLILRSQHKYLTTQDHSRVIIQIENVPRGTK